MRRFFLVYTLTAACRLFSQETVQVRTFDELFDAIHRPNDTTYVVNFWATWCRPCLEELPLFEALQNRFPGSKLKVILVSLDLKSQLDTRLRPFVKKYGLTSSVVWLDEPDGNTFIDKVSTSWSGAIPATLILNNSNGTQLFYEKQFQNSELETIIQKIIERK